MAFKYCNIDWTPTASAAGVLLKNDKTDRVLLVTEQGVFECTRDGKDKPKELMDCGPATLARVNIAISKAKLAEAK